MPKVATKTIHCRRFTSPWIAQIHYEAKEGKFRIPLHPDIAAWSGNQSVYADSQAKVEALAEKAAGEYSQGQDKRALVIIYGFTHSNPDTFKRGAGQHLGFWAAVTEETEFVSSKGSRFQYQRPGTEEIQARADWMHAKWPHYDLNETQAAQGWADMRKGGSYSSQRHDLQMPYTPEAEQWFCQMSKAMTAIAERFQSLADPQVLAAAMLTMPALSLPALATLPATEKDWNNPEPER